MAVLIDYLREKLHAQPTILDLLFWFPLMVWNDILAACATLLSLVLAKAVTQITLRLTRRWVARAVRHLVRFHNTARIPNQPMKSQLD